MSLPADVLFLALDDRTPCPVPAKAEEARGPRVEVGGVIDNNTGNGNGIGNGSR